MDFWTKKARTKKNRVSSFSRRCGPGCAEGSPCTSTPRRWCWSPASPPRTRRLALENGAVVDHSWLRPTSVMHWGIRSSYGGLVFGLVETSPLGTIERECPFGGLMFKEENREP